LKIVEDGEKAWYSTIAWRGGLNIVGDLGHLVREAFRANIQKLDCSSGSAAVFAKYQENAPKKRGNIGA